MAPNFSQATPDRALRFSIISAVNRQAVGSNPTRGANCKVFNQLDVNRTFGRLPNTFTKVRKQTEYICRIPELVCNGGCPLPPEYLVWYTLDVTKHPAGHRR